MAGATPVGTAVPNVPTYFQGPSGQRATVSGASFTNGVNKGGGNAPGIGIATGEADPKVGDWSDDERLLYESQAIGQAAGDITVVQGADINDEVSLVTADGTIAVDGEIKSGTGALNKTGSALSSGDRAWGVVAVA